MKKKGRNNGEGPAVSILVVGWNTRDLLKQCLSSVFSHTTGIRFETIYIDNASTDGSVAMVKAEFPQTIIIENQTNIGFVAANNLGMDIARGRYVLLLNSDTIVHECAIERTVSFADRHPEGAVFGCRVLNPDGSLQRSCFMYPSILNMVLYSTYLYKLFPKNPFFGRQHMSWWDFDTADEVQTVCGCFSLVRLSAIAEVGKMDPVFFFYGDDPDWCVRFSKAGWKIFFVPDGSIIHLGGQSTKKMKRKFKLQLHGSDLLFMRLHRSYPSFLAACLLTSLFFFFRAPLWLIKACIKPSSRVDSLETFGTYALGGFFALFRWKKLLLNGPVVAERLRGVVPDFRLRK